MAASWLGYRYELKFKGGTHKTLVFNFNDPLSVGVEFDVTRGIISTMYEIPHYGYDWRHKVSNPVTSPGPVL